MEEEYTREAAGGEPAESAAAGKISVALPATKTPRSRLRRALLLMVKVAAVGTILVVLASRFSALESDALWKLLAGAGWSIGFVLIPPLLALVADTAGLALCLHAPLRWPLLVRVLPARLGCDTLCNAIPGGVAVAETFRPIVLSRSLRADIKECVAASLMGKVNMAGAQGLFLAGTALVVLSRGGSAGSPLSGAPAVLSAVLLAALFAVLVLFYWGPRLAQAQKLLGRFPGARWQAFMGKFLAATSTVDDHVRSFSRGRVRKLLGSIGAFLAGWVLAGAESYAILTLLGTDVSIFQGLLLEGTASLMRIVFFFLPSAIGAAEVGYTSLIASFGIADPITVSAAFIALKRSREALWLTAGFAILIQNGGKAGRSSPQPGPQTAGSEFSV